MSFFDKFKKKSAGTLNTGSGPSGNPGYSFTGPTYKPKHHDFKTGLVTGGEMIQPGGAVWVGSPGGDTPAARAQFEQWLKSSTIYNGGPIHYLPAATPKKNKK